MVLQELLRLLFKSFVEVLTERLPPISADGDVPNLRAGDPNVNSSARDPEATTMEIDNENGGDNDRSVYYFVCNAITRITTFTGWTTIFHGRFILKRAFCGKLA